MCLDLYKCCEAPSPLLTSDTAYTALLADLASIMFNLALPLVNVAMNPCFFSGSPLTGIE